jgi:hypothetical protein
MLVALGTALFVLVPQQAGLSNEDLSRVIQGVVAGRRLPRRRRRHQAGRRAARCMA